MRTFFVNTRRGTPTEGAERRREELYVNMNRGTPTEGAQRRREEL